MLLPTTREALLRKKTPTVCWQPPAVYTAHWDSGRKCLYTSAQMTTYVARTMLVPVDESVVESSP